jgi:hypothetical protein
MVLTCIINLMGAFKKPMVNTIHARRLDVTTHPYPAQERCAVAEHLDNFGVRFKAIQKRLQALHVPHALSRSKLTLNLFRSIAYIAQCGVAELTIISA